MEVLKDQAAKSNIKRWTFLEWSGRPSYKSRFEWVSALS